MLNRNKFTVIFFTSASIALWGAPVDCNQQCPLGPPNKPLTNQYPDPVTYPAPLNCIWKFSGYTTTPLTDNELKKRSCTLGGIPFWVRVDDSECPGANPDPEYLRCGEPHPACQGKFQEGGAGWGFRPVPDRECIACANPNAFGYVKDEDVEGGWFVEALPAASQEPTGPAEWKLLTYF